MIAEYGIHGILDLHGCSSELLRDAKTLQNILEQCVQHIGATILWSHFHTFGGHGGVTGVLLLAESHISIHTWPETGFAAIDLFLCGNKTLHNSRMFLQQQFCPIRTKWTLCQRGKLILTQ